MIFYNLDLIRANWVLVLAEKSTSGKLFAAVARALLLVFQHYFLCNVFRGCVAVFMARAAFCTCPFSFWVALCESLCQASAKWGGKNKQLHIHLLCAFLPHRVFRSWLDKLWALRQIWADMKRFMHMRQQLWNYLLSFHDQSVMMFEVGFRVNSVIGFVTVLCRVDSPNPRPWDTRVLDLFIQC